MFLERAFDAVAVIRGDAEEYGMHHRIGAKYFRLERFYTLGQIDVVEIPPHKRIETIAVMEENPVARQLGGVFDGENPTLGQFRAVDVRELSKRERRMLRDDRLVPRRKPAAAHTLFEKNVNAVSVSGFAFAPDIKRLTVTDGGRLPDGERSGGSERLGLGGGGSHFDARKRRIDFAVRIDFKLRTGGFFEMYLQVMRRKAGVVGSIRINHDHSPRLSITDKMQLRTFGNDAG